MKNDYGDFFEVSGRNMPQNPHLMVKVQRNISMIIKHHPVIRK